MERVTTKEAAKLLNMDVVTLQFLMRQERLPIGYAIKKDGTMTGDLADREQLKLLRNFLRKLLGELVDDIASGNVQPNPYTRGTSHSACTYCPYGAVCHKEEVEGRRNYKTMSAQRFWEEIGKEMNGNG